MMNDIPPCPCCGVPDSRFLWPDGMTTCLWCGAVLEELATGDVVAVLSDYCPESEVSDDYSV